MGLYGGAGIADKLFLEHDDHKRRLKKGAASTSFSRWMGLICAHGFGLC